MGWHRDTGSTTLEDAGRWERAHQDAGPDEMREGPSADDLRDVEYDRKRAVERRERDAAARARGEYVPEDGWSILLGAMTMTLAQHGVHNVSVTTGRDGVALVTSPEPLDAANIATALNDHEPGRWEARQRDQHAVWVKAEPALLTAFAAPTGPSWDAGPPF